MKKLFTTTLPDPEFLKMTDFFAPKNHTHFFLTSPPQDEDGSKLTQENQR